MEMTSEYNSGRDGDFLDEVFPIDGVFKPSRISTATTDMEKSDEESVNTNSLNNAELPRYYLQRSFLAKDTSTT